MGQCTSGNRESPVTRSRVPIRHRHTRHHPATHARIPVPVADAGAAAGSGSNRRKNLSLGITTLRPSLTEGIDPFSMLAVIVRGSTPSAAAASARVITALLDARNSSKVTVLSRITTPPFLIKDDLHPKIQHRA